MENWFTFVMVKRWWLVPLLCVMLDSGVKVLATQRAVMTFHSADLVVAGSAGVEEGGFIVVKQYGRRLVLDVGREFVDPSDVTLLKELAGVDRVENVEADELVEVSQNREDSPPLVVDAQVVPYTATATALNRSLNLYEPLWNLADSEPYSIHVEGVWGHTNSTPDVVVAVLDSGIAEAAEGLFLNLLGGYDFVSDSGISLDGDERDADPMDPGDSGPECLIPSWHGTKVASVLAARHDNSLGIKGVASNCSVLPIPPDCINLKYSIMQCGARDLTSTGRHQVLFCQ